MVWETVRNMNSRTRSKRTANGNSTGRNARAHEVGEPALGSGEAENAIGGRDQPARKSDPFGLIAVEQHVGRAAREHRRQFPGEIDGVADAGVHALAAGRAMDMRRVADAGRRGLCGNVRVTR